MYVSSTGLRLLYGLGSLFCQFKGGCEGGETIGSAYRLKQAGEKG